MDWLITAVRSEAIAASVLAAVMLVVLGLFFSFDWRVCAATLLVVFAVSVLYPGGAAGLVGLSLRRIRAFTSYTPAPREAPAEEAPRYRLHG